MKSSISLSARSLSVHYNGLSALEHLTMDIPSRQITSLIGASGSGKSTFLRSINRMLDAVPSVKVEGELLFEGKNILAPDTDVISLRRSVGMVFQNPTPFPSSIADNIAYGLEIQGKYRRSRRGFGRFFARKPTGAEMERSADPVDQIIVRSLKEAALWDEVHDRLHQSAFRLSGGQQQRLCIARAIAIRPSVLLLDEPCSDLDPLSTHKIEDLLLQLKDNFTIIIVTHNMHQARRISDHVGFFHLGKLIEYGTTKAIFDSPREKLTQTYVRGEFG